MPPTAGGGRWPCPNSKPRMRIDCALLHPSQQCSASSSESHVRVDWAVEYICSGALPPAIMMTSSHVPRFPPGTAAGARAVGMRRAGAGTDPAVPVAAPCGRGPEGACRRARRVAGSSRISATGPVTVPAGTCATLAINVASGADAMSCRTSRRSGAATCPQKVALLRPTGERMGQFGRGCCTASMQACR